MKKYFTIYKTLILLNWYALVEYRTSFITKVLSSMLFTAYHVITVLLLTNTVSSIFGWSRLELLLLASTYSVFIGLYHMFISHNMSRLSEEVYFGRLDFLLLKPVDSQFLATFWLIDFVNGFRVVVGLFLSWYFLHNMNLSITFIDVMLYSAVMILGLCILYSIWVSVISLTIFNPRLSNVVDLLYHITEIGRYPGEMYRQVSVYIFALLLPFTLIMIPATRVLLHEFTWKQAAESVGVCIIISVLARTIWKYSLRFYTSASS